MAVWFNQPWIADQLGEGTRVLLHGELHGRGSQFWVAEHELARAATAPVAHLGLVPVYPGHEGLSRRAARAESSAARAAMLDAVEPLPAALRVAERLPDRAGGARGGALPGRRGGRAGARRRLAFEELFLLQLAWPRAGARRREGGARGRSQPRGELVDPLALRRCRSS